MGKHLRKSGFTVLDAEPAPAELSDTLARHHGYGIYSARYGNIYSPRQLLQLIRDASSGAIRDEDFWARDGRFYDALRPGVEPAGLGSLEEAVALRLEHLAAVKRLFSDADVLVFTLGLTEAWVNRASGIIYPSCPGVIAGDYSDERYAFVNFTYEDVIADLEEIRRLLKRNHPSLRFMFTVSPVPLTATASGQNVLVATTYSKSVLRAACGSMFARFEDVDYFPSYEMIASPVARGYFYEPNMRSVNTHGVQHVMRTFLRAHLGEEMDDMRGKKRATAQKGRKNQVEEDDDVVCEDALLGAFAK